MNKTIRTFLEETIQGNPIKLDYGILQNKEGVCFIPANIELEALEISMIRYINKENILKQFVEQIKDEYDYILIDCRPSLGLLTINALATADSVIIPVQAQYLPLKGMTQLLQAIDKTKMQINPNLKIEGILLTIADMRTNLTKVTIETLRKNYGRHIKIYDSVIPMGVRTAECAIEGKSLYAYDKNSKPAKAYEEFVKEVLSSNEKSRDRNSQCR